MSTQELQGIPLILHLLHSHHTLRPVQICRITGLSKQRVHIILKSLLSSHQIIKKGTAPRTYYLLKTADKQSSRTLLDLTPQQTDILDRDFLLIKREGRQLTGAAAVCDYAQSMDKDPQHVAEEFLAERAPQHADVTTCYASAPDQLELLEVKTMIAAETFSGYHFADYHTVSHFGRTAFAKRLLKAKASRDAVLQHEIFRETEAQIHECIADYGIDAIAFVPGCSPAGREFMHFWKIVLDLPLPHVPLVRAVERPGVSPQVISLPEDQQEHIAETLVISDHGRYQHVLIIDDQVLTGATMHHAARLLLDRGTAQKVSAYSLLYDQET